MTLHEKVQKECANARHTAGRLQKELERAVQDAARDALTDYAGMTPGLGLAHAALNVAILRTRLGGVLERIDMLEWLLREETGDTQL